MLVRRFLGEDTGLDIGLGVIVSSLFTAYYSSVSPYKSDFDLFSMQPTQYIIMLTMACGIMKSNASQDNWITDLVIAIAIIGLTTPTMLLLLVRLISPSMGDKLIKKTMLFWRRKERKKVRDQLQEIFALDHEEYIVSEALGAHFPLA